MKRVYSSQDPLLAGHLKNILEVHGIDCVTRNTYLTGAVGEIPPIECWPELWVIDDAKYDEAKGLIEQNLSSPATEEKPWKCRKCGEEVEGQFSECWNCGTSRGG